MLWEYGRRPGGGQAGVTRSPGHLDAPIALDGCDALMLRRTAWRGF
jgi:hypothetical protein